MRFVIGVLLALVIGNANEAFAEDQNSANYLLPACRDFAGESSYENTRSSEACAWALSKVWSITLTEASVSQTGNASSDGARRCPVHQ